MRRKRNRSLRRRLRIRQRLNSWRQIRRSYPRASIGARNGPVARKQQTTVRVYPPQRSERVEQKSMPFFLCEGSYKTEDLIMGGQPPAFSRTLPLS